MRTVALLGSRAFSGRATASKPLPLEKQLRNTRADWGYAFKSACFIAFDGRSPAGYVMAGLDPYAWENEKTARIYNIAVAEAHRGKGLATTLIERSLAALRKAGVGRVELKVRNKNLPAMRLYQKLGFRTSALEMTRVI